MTAIQLRHAAEIWTTDGPTGRFAEVLRGEVRDNGGNVLHSGTADECLYYTRRLRLAHHLVPTEWRTVDGEVADADYTWQCVIG